MCVLDGSHCPGGINFRHFGLFFFFFFYLFNLLTDKKIFNKNKKTQSRENLILHIYTTYYNHWVLGMSVIAK